MADKKPVVSIGMPVYNGSGHIAKALDSLLAQGFSDFELIISDNASTDATFEICRKYAQADPRIICERQPENRGALWNFNHVLQRARGEYFMWAAADDEWEPEFISENLKALQGDRSIVASISRVGFPNKAVTGKDTYPLMSGTRRNMLRYLYAPRENSRFYALFRRDPLSKCVDDDDFHAKDWAIVMKTLAYGKYYQVDKLLFRRTHRGQLERGMLQNISDGSPLCDKLLPMYRFSKEIVAGGFPLSVKLLGLPMLALNNLLYALMLLKERVIR
jgi:glycosyltransferase involved in cell wall biosynthesis